MTAYRGTVQLYAGGFTLIEVLVAVAISAILILGVNTVLYNSFHLRDRAYESAASTTTQQYALKIMKRDLLNLIPPNGTLAGDFYGETNIGDVRESDRLTLYTTTGSISETEVWGEIQKVQYALMEVKEYGEEYNYFLVRAVTRNVSTTIEEIPEVIPLLSNVVSLRFYYYDGESWTRSWDPEVQETSLPMAVRVEMILSPHRDGEQERNKNFITRELVVPILAESFTLDPSSEETEEQGTEGSGGQTEQQEGDNTQQNQPMGGGGRS